MKSRSKQQNRIRRNIWNNQTVRWASGLILLFLFVGLFANFIAHEYPIYYQSGNTKSWPLFSHLAYKMGMRSNAPAYIDYKTTPYDVAIFAPIPFSSESQTDLKNRLLPPLSTREIGSRTYLHLLGTDRLGKDVAAGLVHGCRKSLFIGLFAMLISLLIGGFLGILAAYWGNHSIRVNIIRLFFQTLSFGYLCYMVYYHQYDWVGWVLVLLLLLIPIVLNKWLLKIRLWIRLPLDHLVMRLIEVFNSIPTLLIILAISSIILTPTSWSLAFIIGFISWTSFARYTRAEILKVKEQNYILASKISGLSHRQILWRYVLPEIIGPIAVLFTFGVAGSILIESTLSFLNIGVPYGELTWGALLRQARDNIQAWWLAIFPGLAIFSVILILQALGNSVRSVLNPAS